MKHLNTFLIGSFILTLVLCYIYHTLKDKSYFYNKKDLDLKINFNLLKKFKFDFAKNFERKVKLEIEYR